jgi:hypothetical protein
MTEHSAVPNPTLIYHITDLVNLSSMACHGLLANSCIQRDGIEYVNIAYDNLQARRARRQVPLAPHGCLHDYVPFYFAPRSPMLYTINHGNVLDYQRGQTSVVHLVSTIQIIAEAGIPFVFTDAHAVVAYASFYNSIADLDNVDWELMTSNLWFDCDEYPDRKQRRQAEFLIYQHVPCSLLIEIGVLNAKVAERARIILAQAGLDIPVRVRRGWYY